MVEFYLLTFPRFPLRKKEHKSYFGFGNNRTHDFRTSRCAGASYLLFIDHSDDEQQARNNITPNINTADKNYKGKKYRFKSLQARRKQTKYLAAVAHDLAWVAR